MISDDVLTAAVGETATMITQDMGALLSDLQVVSEDKAFVGRPGLALLLRGASSAALDALTGGPGRDPAAPLVRLAAASWIALLILSLADQERGQARPPTQERV